MSESPFSPIWYRCKSLKPQLRSHTHIHRHEYRDELWYVLEDPSSGRFHRFTPAAYFVIGLMNGAYTVEEIWRRALEELGEEAPTQGEVVQLLGQLHSADVLQSDVPPDVLEIFTRHKRQRVAKWKQRFANPLAVRFPLVDPERFLTRTLPAVRPLFGWFGVLLWLAVMALGTASLVTHWSELTEDVVDRALSMQNLVVLWLVYPLVKAVHELGHAYATKKWGGEVHEIGVMLLVLVPVPYVEASSASAFRSKRQRMVVGAAGILVELFLAAVALLVWVNVQPGVVSTVAYNVMLIGGVSTLFFNGNPLLRFDGYYVLADAIEVPNLATRSKRYLGYLVQRYAFGAEDLKSPATVPGERGWLFAYGIASFLYRMFIMFVIVVFIAGKYFIVGVLLAVWAVTSQIVVPFVKMLASIVRSPQIKRHRLRAVFVSAVTAAVLFALLFMVPMPLATRAQGIVWIPEHAQVRAGADGVVATLLAEEGSLVEQGQPLIVTRDPFMGAQVKYFQARLRELEARLTEEEFANPNRAAVIRQEIIGATAELDRALERLETLTIRSPARGRFILPDAPGLVGRFLRRGERVAYIDDQSTTTVRVVVDQDDIGLVREHTRSVEVRSAVLASRPVRVDIRRQVPAASDELPSQALGTAGGGSIPVDPRDPSGLRTLDKVFQLDVILPGQAEAGRLGGRMYVRFDHGREAPAMQLYRAVRQLFLSRFNV